MNILFSTNWSHLPCTGPVCPAPGYLLFPLLFGLTALPWKSCAFFGKKLLLLGTGEETDLLRLSNTCSKNRKKVPFRWEFFYEGDYLSLSRAACFPSYARAFQVPSISSSRSSCPLLSASHLETTDRQADRHRTRVWSPLGTECLGDSLFPHCLSAMASPSASSRPCYCKWRT